MQSRRWESASRAHYLGAMQDFVQHRNGQRASAGRKVAGSVPGLEELCYCALGRQFHYRFELSESVLERLQMHFRLLHLVRYTMKVFSTVPLGPGPGLSSNSRGSSQSLAG